MSPGCQTVKKKESSQVATSRTLAGWLLLCCLACLPLTCFSSLDVNDTSVEYRYGAFCATNCEVVNTGRSEAPVVIATGVFNGLPGDSRSLVVQPWRLYSVEQCSACEAAVVLGKAGGSQSLVEQQLQQRTLVNLGLRGIW